jgi:hypothetical protein
VESDTRLLKELFLLLRFQKSYVIAEMREKVRPASVLPVVNYFSPASAFRHQDHSGIAGHG